MRASFNVLGPLLARSRQAKVSLPGGDPIGARPLNFHLDALAELGATIDLNGGYVFAQAPRGLKGGHVVFPAVSVGATEHTMLAAVLARGETLIENAAMEPEIVDLADCLNAMGARIEGAGTPTLQIQGVSHLNGATHAVMPDRIEAGTYAMAVAMAGGDVTLKGVRCEHLLPLIERLKAAGVEVVPEGSTIAVRRKAGERLRAVDVETAPFPGFATDLQAQFMALMTLADGESVIRETIFENRFIHAAELARMGADISVQGGEARVSGVNGLTGAQVAASDVRAGVSLVIAGLAARGRTLVEGVYHLDRGFERLEEKLQACGAQVERVSSEMAA